MYLRLTAEEKDAAHRARLLNPLPDTSGTAVLPDSWATASSSEEGGHSAAASASSTRGAKGGKNPPKFPAKKK